jgi:hypothetical protein
MIRFRAALNSLAAGLVLAGTLATTAAPLSADTSPTPTPATPAVSPSTAPPGSSFDQRLNLRKQEQNEQLTADQQKQLQGQCVGAQGVIRKLLVTTTPMLDKRNSTYVKIDGMVWADVGQLKLAAKDTFQLEQEQLALAKDIATFKTTASNYQESLNDLLAINCQADIVGFQALLDTARSFYQELQNQASAIYSYTVNTIQPTIDNYVTQLQIKDDASTSEDQ